MISTPAALLPMKTILCPDRQLDSRFRPGVTFKGKITMRHLMIDLETLGVSANAPIIAIGACFFDPNTGRYGECFDETIDFESALRYGVFDASTIRWWMQQSDEAREKAISGKSSLDVALRNFVDFCTQEPVEIYPWGNGAIFDVGILENALRLIGYKEPWSFRNVRDSRTIEHICEEMGLGPIQVDRVGTHHSALDDAIYQAAVVSKCWQAIRHVSPDKF